nr:M20/M25/M40 family metallo-hydrolase [Deltaproteobacteria bacterium]
LLVGAHFDSVPAGPGAADNATGVAIVLATARYLQSVTPRHHPIVFALFDEEELGLKGSRAYAASLTDQDIAAAHVFDMLSFDGDADRAVELWSPSPTLLPIYEEHGVLAAMPIQPVTFDRSDHQAFLERGIPAVGIGEEFESGDHTPHYHKATDTFDRVSFEHCGAVTHLAFSVLESSVRTP